MQTRYENWTNGLNGDWCVSRQRFFGVPFPVWYPLDANGQIDHTRPIAAAEDRLPVDPSTDVPAGFTEAQRGKPGGFVGDPDIMDTWATSSLTPQIVCRLGRRSGPVRAHVSDGPEAPGARHHPHVALRHGAAIALRARLAAVEERGAVGLGPRSGSQEDVEVEGQRRHAARPARRARFRRRALLGGERPAGHRHGVRHEPDEGRPPARDEAAQRVEVRAERGRAEGADQLAGRPCDAAQPGRTGRRGHRGVRGLRLRARAAADRDVLLALLRRLPRARQGPPLRRTGAGSGRIRQRGAVDWRCRSCCASSPRSCPS